MPQNTCAEETIKKAFDVVLDRVITFNTELAKNDIQIDFNPVFLAQEGISMLLLTGHDPILLANSFRELNPQVSYFLRTGTMNGAGHWQLLYYKKDTLEWRIYSTATNYFICTNPDGSLTPEAASVLVTKHGAWGLENGQYVLLLQEATRDRTISAANFVTDVRLSSNPNTADEMAINHLFNASNTPPTMTTGYFSLSKSLTDKEGTPALEAIKAPTIDPVLFEPLKATLTLIDAKATDLFNRQFFDDARVARTLCSNISEEIDRFLAESMVNAPIAMSAFKQQCLHHVSEAKPALEKHRGWKQVLGNLGLLIAGLGIGYLIAGLIHQSKTQKFLFFETDSATKLTQLVGEIDKISPK